MSQIAPGSHVTLHYRPAVLIDGREQVVIDFSVIDFNYPRTGLPLRSAVPVIGVL